MKWILQSHIFLHQIQNIYCPTTETLGDQPNWQRGDGEQMLEMMTS